MPGSGIALLRLTVREFTDLTRWRWTLTDADGAFLAGHEVRLDPQAERFEAFTSLRDYRYAVSAGAGGDATGRSG
jgi:hypothetical protein